ncbi:MAG: hypothetical protein V3U92_09520 [Cellulophaga sp.]
MYYYLVLALNAYCIYHCYSNRNEYYWFFLIFFIPVFGSVIYLFLRVFRARDLEIAQATISTVINPTRKILNLEKRFQFSKSFKTQVALADGYLEIEDFDNAIKNYSETLEGVFKNDFYVFSKLVEAYYFSSKFEQAIVFAEKIKDNTKFKKSDASFLYALALEKTGNVTLAEEKLLKFDAPYSNHKERLVLAQFFIRNKKITEAKTVLEEMISESEQMSKQGYRDTKILIRKAREELAAIS